MDTIKFNTQREYTKYGQRIAAAQLDNGHVVMVDIDRHVDILFPLGVGLNQAEIMQAYDHGWQRFPNDIDMSYVDYYVLIEELRQLANTWTNNSIN